MGKRDWSAITGDMKTCTMPRARKEPGKSCEKSESKESTDGKSADGRASSSSIEAAY